MSLQATDQASAAIAKAPRVSLADIEHAISDHFYFTADEAVRGAHGAGAFVVEPLRCLSICIIVMKNGFTVVGKSAPASPENFDAALGRKFAYDDAMRQLWPLMGFALREKLSQK